MGDRLEPLLRLREKREEEAAMALAAAQRGVDEARRALARLLEAGPPQPSAADAAWWALDGAWAERRRAAITAAERAVVESEAARDAARAVLEAAHRAAEAIRRAIARRREAARRAAERRERKAQDEIASLLHVHRRR